MAVIKLDQMTTLQMLAAEALYRKCCAQKESNFYATGLVRTYYKASMDVRKRCLPRGKAYARAYRREMNPSIDFSLPVADPERYNHMKKRLWAK